MDIPSSATSIGDSAFYGCASLSSVDIPSSVTSIGSYAFKGLSFCGYDGKKLSHDPAALAGHVFLGSGTAILTMAYRVDVVAADPALFETSGTGWYLPRSEAVVSATPVGGYVLEGWYDGSILLSSDPEYRFTVHGDLSLTATVTPVGVGTLVHVSGLIYKVTSMDPLSASLVGYEGSPSDVIIPASVDAGGSEAQVVSVGTKAFPYCNGLETLVIPGSLSYVGAYTFFKCVNLKTLVVEDGVRKILGSAGRWSPSTCPSRSYIWEITPSMA